MADKLWLLGPELLLFIGAVVVAVMGLSPSRAVRAIVPGTTAAFLLLALLAVPAVYTADRLAALEGELLMPALGRSFKAIVAVVGLLLVLVNCGVVDARLERDLESGRMRFDPLRVARGEFFAFFLLSLCGLMLCANATDLVWLFLALELTSLPTYIMVAVSRPSPRAQEASMKYFFLGALASATFLYGFALLYGGTGTVGLPELRDVLAQQRAAGEWNQLVLVGFVLSIVGIGYKLAAVPMHFYAADVYEGAAAPVTAFIGFVPKAAGAVGLMLLLETVGWKDGLPPALVTALWMIAVLTMTLGNAGALLQRSVKRMLAYSSIAHSGYLLIGILAGPGLGFAAVLFHLFAYGVMNTGALAVLAALERRGVEIESIDDLQGLRVRQPLLAWALAACCGSLLGFPPLLGFVGKLLLFAAGVQAGHVPLVVIAGLNSAVSAWYYLQLPSRAILGAPDARSESIEPSPIRWPRLAALAAAAACIVLPLASRPLLDAVKNSLAMPARTAEAPAPADRG